MSRGMHRPGRHAPSRQHDTMLRLPTGERRAITGRGGSHRPAMRVRDDDDRAAGAVCAAGLLIALANTVAAMWRHRSELPALWRETDAHPTETSASAQT